MPLVTIWHIGWRSVVQAGDGVSLSDAVYVPAVYLNVTSPLIGGPERSHLPLGECLEQCELDFKTLV